MYVNAIVLKYFAHFVCETFAFFINKSTNTDILPDFLKYTNSDPEFKI